MKTIKYRKQHEYSNFCFCLGLLPGVIISSILWMIEGIFFFTVFIYSVLAIVTGVGMITSKDGFINYCIDMGNNVDNHCINKVNSQLLWLAIILLFLGSVHVSILIFFDPYLKFIFFIYFFFL